MDSKQPQILHVPNFPHGFPMEKRVWEEHHSLWEVQGRWVSPSLGFFFQQGQEKGRMSWPFLPPSDDRKI